MVAEICSRFGGYPSDYIKKHTIRHLFYDHDCFMSLVEDEKNELRKLEK